MTAFEKSLEFINEVLLVNGKKLPHLEELRRNCQKIADSISEITKWAKQCDYGEIHANGYWTYIKVVRKFVDIMESAIRGNNSYPLDENLVAVSRVLVHYLDKLFEVREQSGLDENFNNKSRLFAAHCSQITQYFTDYCDGTKYNDIKSVYSHYNGFWYSWSQAAALNTFGRVIALMAKFPESLVSLWDSSYRGNLLYDVMRNATVEFPFSVWGIADWRAHTKILVPIMNIWQRVDTKTIQVPRQGTWVIPEWSEGRVQRKYLSELSGSRAKVRCRLLQRNTTAENDTLVLHVHGGGFVTHTPDAHEMYLRHWAANIGGVPILSVDYSLKVKYPIALQEILDVYLWAVSGQPEVQQILGFQPKKIVICGDSAGGILCMALYSVLVDIEKELNKKQESFSLTMPASFVGIYTAFNFNQVAPSLILSTIEPILALGPLLACLGQYVAGVRYEDDFEEIQKERRNKELVSDSADISWSEEAIGFDPVKGVKKLLQQLLPWTRKPWYHCDQKQLDDRLAYIHDIARHPYMNTMSEDLMDSLKRMPVYLISCHYDIFLDHNVEFCKEWKGDISFDVVDDVPHGFLHWGFVSKEAQEASDVCLKRLQQAVGFH